MPWATGDTVMDPVLIDLFERLDRLIAAHAFAAFCRGADEDREKIHVMLVGTDA